VTPPARPDDVPSLLGALLASDPGRPRVTWYGPGGERVELSARVLENWVAKTANLLVEDLDAGPASRVRLDLPPHWRAAVWALATWAVGAAPAEQGEAADVVVAPEPARGPLPEAARLVVVALPALARSASGAPAGALDYNAEVSGFGDVFVPGAPAALPPASSSWPHGVRLLVTPDAWHVRRTLLDPLRADGSVVLCHTADEAFTKAVCEQERVTASASAGPRPA
jgi:uncharacterized protein (TIGR03089 family)